MAGEQELADLERAEVEEAKSHEERHRACAPTETRRLEIDEHGPRERPGCSPPWNVLFTSIRAATDFQRRVEHRETIAHPQLAVAYADLTVPAIGLVPPIDGQTPAERRADNDAAQHLADAIEIERGLVPADIRLVGQLAPGR